MMSAGANLAPRSLVWATSIDVLPIDCVVARGDGYLTVLSPSNPTHYWGNLLIFDRPPRAGDRPRWEALFQQAFADQPASVHRVFAWDLGDDVRGAADEEFAPFGYDVELSTGLIAAPDQIQHHPRANRDVEVRALDPRGAGAGGGDEPMWDEVLEVWVSGRDDRFSQAAHRRFSASRLADLRRLFLAGRGAWYVALADGRVVASCGVVVTDGRGRFQAVDTLAAYRRRGICSRLLVEAAHHAVEHHGAGRLVIVADPQYHAIGIYESVGFEPVERVGGVCHPPP